MVKVILKERIESLGNEGEIVEVADGYGRNFLLRKKLVLEATPGNIKQWEEKGRIIQQRKEKVKLCYLPRYCSRNQEEIQTGNRSP